MATESSLVRGLDGISVPTCHISPAAHLLANNALPSEIQELAIGQSATEAILGAVDCFGNALIQPLNEQNRCSGEGIRLPPANELM